MSTKFNMTEDINGYNGFGIQPTLDIFSGSLTANAAQSITVPNNYPYWIAIISSTPGSNIWVSFTTTAVVGSGAFASSSSSLNPAARRVKGGSTISLITSDTDSPQISVEFQVVSPYQN